MYSGFFKGEMLLLEIYFEKNTLLFCTEIYLKPFAVFGEKNLLNKQTTIFVAHNSSSRYTLRVF